MVAFSIKRYFILLHLTDIAFFSDLFVATLPHGQASLWTHFPTAFAYFMCHILVILKIFQTFIIVFIYFFLFFEFYFVYSRFLLVIHLIHISVYMSIPISQFTTPTPTPLHFPPLVSICLFSASVSISVLQTGSSVPLF